MNRKQDSSVNAFTPTAVAVELHPHSRTHWAATYYPMVVTPAGRWADVTWTLHQCLMPTTHPPGKPARWLDLRSPDPAHPGYATHQAWRAALATGYTAALAVYHAEATQEPLLLHEAQQLRAGTVVVPAGQLSEWVLDDLQEESSDVHG
ncbi:hypothetical protein [Kocuria rosea]|uniref:hypothetical protein n=1 Tax=Kocuria rosea TaxID=1275 RepID=UPI00203D4549|nr:hypothetical protein [Kocuria rosea]MCM3689382.1 hypothetical protein [Kocuria rosea]